METKQILDSLYSELQKNANQSDSAFMSKYMKDKFLFFGIKKPFREEIEKKYYPALTKLAINDLKELVSLLWILPERECQYIAMVILDKNLKTLDGQMLDLLEELIITKSWWDTVDYLAAKPVGYILKGHPDLIDKYIKKWMDSGNMWLQRTCLLFQLKYKKDTDYNLLFSLSKELSGSKEFFIQKAIGWALREYSKTNPESVQNFIDNNHLAPLSVREGLRIINKS
jgi:3-methyladenine DNA glycosylase AlkD